MNTEFLLDLGNWVLLSTAIPLALFVGYYYFRSPWKKLMVGRSLMYFAMSLLLIVLVVVMSLFLGPDYFLREWVRLFGYTLVAATMWRLFFTLRHIQNNPPPAPNEIGLADFNEDDILAFADGILLRRSTGQSSLESDNAS
jgi:hypothetical protein